MIIRLILRKRYTKYSTRQYIYKKIHHAYMHGMQEVAGSNKLLERKLNQEALEIPLSPFGVLLRSLDYTHIIYL
jgi:hypothetical protein